MTFTAMHGDRPIEHNGLLYISFLDQLVAELSPRAYFEIGTNTGLSLARFPCDAVCVDPNFLIEHNVYRERKRTLLFQMTSDDFFADQDLRAFFPAGPDIAFLDGMHRAEFLLRDFMKTERKSHAHTLILFHDCLPLNARMAERIPRLGEEDEGAARHFWTGDVWRVLFALNEFRPDLRIRYLDCPPTGLVAVTKLDPHSTVLDRSYDDAVQAMMALELDEPTLRRLWNLYPFLATAEIMANPGALSALLNCR